METPSHDDLGTLRREVDRLRAYEEIRKLIYGYARALDRLDQTLLLSLFWPDAEVDYGEFYRGPVGGFIEVAIGFQGSMRDTQHLVGNVMIEFDGSTARSESYVQAHHTVVQGADTVQLLVGASYLDRFERRDACWRISYRTEVMDWGRWLPVPERWFESSNELPKGRRNLEDLSYRHMQRSAPPRTEPT